MRVRVSVPAVQLLEGHRHGHGHHAGQWVVVPVRAGEDAAPHDDDLEGDGVDEADEDRLREGAGEG